MTVADIVRLALRNLGQARLRTALTTLGVAIGIASLAGMVSLGVGLEDQLVGRFVQSGVFDSITVLPGQARGRGAGLGGRGGLFGRGGRRGGGPAQATTPEVPLDDAAIAAIGAIEHVKSAYPNVRVNVELRYGQAAERSMATGVPMSARSDGVFQSLAFGSFFADEVQKTCLISLDMAKRLTDKDPATLVGEPVTIAYAATPAPGAVVPSGVNVQEVDEPYRIVGIVERDPGAGLGAGAISGLMLPLAQAEAIDALAARTPQSILGLETPATGARAYTSITVKVAKAEFTQDVEDKIKTLGYSAFSVNDALAGAKRAFIILDIVLSLIGSIALAVSSLGIVNTMVMSILERTREIGIMKAIGGSDVDIRRIFLVEASAIGVLGGVAGVTLGWLVGRIINFGANLYIQSQGGAPGNLFSLPFWLIGGAIAFSWVVSLIAGSYPAARAARLDPIQALRHD